jgi:hypothetical protein
MILAQSGLGKPKMPEEIAGIATDSHLSLQAQTRVLQTELLKRAESSLLP